MKKVLIFVGILVLAVGILLIMGLCTISECRIMKSAELRKLENLVSDIQLKTGQEISRTVQDEGKVLGEQEYAEIFIKYRPVNNYTKKDVFNEIIAGLLDKNNWKADEWNTDPNFYSASLKDGYDIIIVNVHLDSNANFVSVRVTHG